MALGRGPGGGPKRRIRTRMNRVGKPGSNVVMVSRNGSEKALPSNWRELLRREVGKICSAPPERNFGRFGKRPFPAPGVSIPLGSTPDVVLFVLDLAYHDQQRLAIDVALRLSDVNNWPRNPKVTTKYISGDAFVRVELPPYDSLPGATRGGATHQIVLANYAGVPGLNPLHLIPYEARKGKAHYIGVRTTCGIACTCRKVLPAFWERGWEMHY